MSTDIKLIALFDAIISTNALLTKYTKEFKYNWALASPVVLGMLGHTFVGLVDNIMVGQLGTAELAAVSLGNSFIFIAMALGIGFSTAITPLVAEADSEQKYSKCKSAYKHGLFLCSTLGVALFALIFTLKPLMYVMDQPDEVVSLAVSYINIVAISLIPLIIFQGFKQFSDGLSLTKLPMYATLLANVVNVVLNYALIFGKLGFPQLGIIGAGIGTLCSRIVMVIVLCWLLSKYEKSSKYMTGTNFFDLEKPMLLKIVNLGFPSALQVFFEVGIFTAAIWLSGVLGKNPQAANQIALNLASMTFMVAVGLSVTAMIRVGTQKGLKHFVELRRIAQSIFVMGLFFATIFAVFFLVFHKVLPRIYVDLSDEINKVDNYEVIWIASKLLLIAAVFQLSDSLQVIVLGALRGLQDVKIPTIITFVSYWIIGFPISYYLGKDHIFGSLGIWIGLFCGLTSAALLLYIRFNVLTKRLILQSNN